MERQIGFLLPALLLSFWVACPVWAEEPVSSGGKKVRTVFPKKTELNFDGINIQGEVKAPGEFYFQNRNEEKFDSWVKRRKNFHPEMLRDALMTK